MNSANTEHALILRILKLWDEGGDEFTAAVFELEDLLIASSAPGAFEFDGHEFDADGATIYIYGGSADEMGANLIPIAANFRLASRTAFTKRYGPSGTGASEEHGYVTPSGG